MDLGHLLSKSKLHSFLAERVTALWSDVHVTAIVIIQDPLGALSHRGFSPEEGG